MKTRIIPVLLLWALLCATAIANAQVETQETAPVEIQETAQVETKESQPDTLPPPNLVPQSQPTSSAAAPMPQAAPCGGGGPTCASGGCHGSCWDRLMAWLCYKAQPVPPCACQRVCNYDYYPRLYTYFLLPSAFTGGGSSSPGCQNCFGNR